MPRRIMLLLATMALVLAAMATPATATASDTGGWWHDLPKGVDLFGDGALPVIDDIAFNGQIVPSKSAAGDVLGNINGVSDFLGKTTPGDVADYMRNYVTNH